MEKFLKSIFSSSDKKKGSRTEEEDDREFAPPLDGRRKLSISRSGRMKANNKKRHSLNADLYGQDAYQMAEKPKTIEYHVNTSVHPNSNQVRETASRKTDQQLHVNENHRKGGEMMQEKRKSGEISNDERRSEIEKRKSGDLTPEQEIESAFEIIDKVS